MGGMTIPYHSALGKQWELIDPDRTNETSNHLVFN